MRRFFINPEKVQGQTVALGEEEARHLRDVLRLGPGARLTLFDGQGMEYGAVVRACGPLEVVAEITGSGREEGADGARITLALAMLKADKMDCVLRAATELGLSSWRPFYAARSVSRPKEGKGDARISRWEKIAREAARQCEQARVPEVRRPSSFEELVGMAGEHEISLFFLERETTLFREVLTRSAKAAPKSVLITIGPEGGFDRREAHALAAAGHIPAGLGRRILRAETAALAGMVLAAHGYGDLG